MQQQCIRSAETVRFWDDMCEMVFVSIIHFSRQAPRCQVFDIYVHYY